MKFLRRILGGNVQNTWEVSPGGTVWKVQPTVDGLLVGEVRDLTSKHVSFFSINARDGSIRFTGVRTDEPWWDALEHVLGDVAIVHRYPKPDMPSVLGATAIDVNTGSVLWHRDNVRVLCGTGELALAERNRSDVAKDLVILDTRSGAELEEHELGAERCVQFANSCSDLARFNGWVATTTLRDDSEQFSNVLSVVARNVKERIGPIELIEYNAHTVLGAHCRSRQSGDAMLNNRVDNVLLIVDAQGDVVYNQRITTGAPAPGEDSFFVFNGVLTFIREGITIVGIDLNN